MLRSAASSMAPLLRRLVSSRPFLLPILHRPAPAAPSPPNPLSPFVPVHQFVAGNLRSYANDRNPVSEDDDDDDDDDDEFDGDEIDEFGDDEIDGTEMDFGSDDSEGDSGDKDISDD